MHLYSSPHVARIIIIIVISIVIIIVIVQVRIFSP